MDPELCNVGEFKKVASNNQVLRLVKPSSMAEHRSRRRYLDAVKAAKGAEAAQRVAKATRTGKEVEQTASKWEGHAQS